MTDETLDVLLEAVNQLAAIVLHGIDPPPSVEIKLVAMLKKLDALARQRKGRDDNTPAKGAKSE